MKMKLSNYIPRVLFSVIIGGFPALCMAQIANFKLLGVEAVPDDAFEEHLDVSDDGAAVSITAGGMSYRWQENTGAVNIGATEPENNQIVANGISSDGEKIVGYIKDVDANTQSAFLWRSDQGVMHLEEAEGQQQAGSDQAHAISDNNVIAGDQGYWDENLMQHGLPLITFSDGQFFPGLANGGVSADGVFLAGIGFMFTSSSGTVPIAFRYHITNGTYDFFEPLPIEGVDRNGAWPAPVAISADGSVLVGSSFSRPSPSEVDHVRAVRWVTENAEDLGLLEGDTQAVALAVNSDGSLIFGASGSSDSAVDNTGFIWDSTNGMQDMNDLLVERGADLQGLRVAQVTGASSDGRFIVGWATDGTQLHAFLADLDVTPAQVDQSLDIEQATLLKGLVIDKDVLIIRATFDADKPDDDDQITLFVGGQFIFAQKWEDFFLGKLIERDLVVRFDFRRIEVFGRDSASVTVFAHKDLDDVAQDDGLTIELHIGDVIYKGTRSSGIFLAL